MTFQILVARVQASSSQSNFSHRCESGSLVGKLLTAELYVSSLHKVCVGFQVH